MNQNKAIMRTYKRSKDILLEQLTFILDIFYLK